MPIFTESENIRRSKHRSEYWPDPPVYSTDHNRCSLCTDTASLLTSPGSRRPGAEPLSQDWWLTEGAPGDNWLQRRTDNGANINKVQCFFSMFGYKYLNLDNKSYCARRNVRNDLWVMGQVKFSKHFCSQHHVQAGLIVLWWCWTLLAWFRNLLLWLWPCPVSALYTFLLLTRPGINNVIRHPPHMELIVPPSQHDSLTADTHPPFLRGVYLRKDP